MSATSQSKSEALTCTHRDGFRAPMCGRKASYWGPGRLPLCGPHAGAAKRQGLTCHRMESPS